MVHRKVTMPKPSYTLVFNITFDNKTRKTPLKVYKKYNNGTLVELRFHSDTFENYRRDNPHRKQIYEMGAGYMIFNSTPRVIAWDGRYYLMFNGYSLIKYNDKEFTIYRLQESYYTPYWPTRIIPLGNDCWIITYVSEGDPFNGIMVFNGKEVSRKIIFRYDSNIAIKIKRLKDCKLKIVKENEGT